MPLMKLTRALVSSVVLAALTSVPAVAALGEDASSVEADRAGMKGAWLHVTTAAAYALHEIHTPQGMRVHEYVSPGGKVFAVSWRGPGIPDLRHMLGSYYAQFEQATSAPTRDRHHLSVRTPQVIVQSSGHARAFFGRAWVPALLPANFSLDDIN
jgi:hypothetical protein